MLISVLRQMLNGAKADHKTTSRLNVPFKWPHKIKASCTSSDDLYHPPHQPISPSVARTLTVGPDTMKADPANSTTIYHSWIDHGPKLTKKGKISNDVIITQRWVQRDNMSSITTTTMMLASCKSIWLFKSCLLYTSPSPRD